jgi:hypothetical protein
MMTVSSQCFDELVTECSTEGSGAIARTPPFMNKVADTFGPVQRSVNRTLKKALDPNGILAPGNQLFDYSERRTSAAMPERLLAVSRLGAVMMPTAHSGALG